MAIMVHYNGMSISTTATTSTTALLLTMILMCHMNQYIMHVHATVA